MVIIKLIVTKMIIREQMNGAGQEGPSSIIVPVTHPQSRRQRIQR